MSADRNAGIFLILTAAVTVVSVFARVAADADQPTLAESLAAIAQNQAAYLTGGLARIVSGLTLLLAGCLLSQRPLALLLMASGLLTAISGGATVALVAVLPYVAMEAVSPDLIVVPPVVHAIADARWIAGKAGFTLAGLALISAAVSWRRLGGIPRLMALPSLLIGAAMLFIWIDAATIMHRITGPAFVLWLLAAGTLLLFGIIRAHVPGLQHQQPSRQ